MAQALRFLARGTGMVPDYAAQAGGVRRFHGFVFDTSLGPKFQEKDDLGRVTGRVAQHGAFVKQIGLVVEVPSSSRYLSEYIRHLRDGDLWPADEATAQWCGRPFDPLFGGEHTDGVRSRQSEAIRALKRVTSAAPDTNPDALVADVQAALAEALAPALGPASPSAVAAAAASPK